MSPLQRGSDDTRGPGKPKPRVVERIEMPSLAQDAATKKRVQEKLETLVKVDEMNRDKDIWNRGLLGHFRALPVGTRVTVVVVLLLVLGVCTIRAYFVSKPTHEAEVTPDTIVVKGLEIVENEKKIRLVGSVSNESGRPIECVTFNVECKAKAGVVTEVISVEHMGPSEVRKFNLAAFNLREIPRSQTIKPGIVRWRVF